MMLTFHGRRVVLPTSSHACCHQAHYFATRMVHRFSATDTVFSAIQPTGIPHLGNWLGTLKNWSELQKGNARLFYAVADLHAITVPQQRDKLKLWRMEALASLLAIGLDPKRCTIFFQSAVSAHSELMWILSCLSSTGYLFRMTSWKSKMRVESATGFLDSPDGNKARLGLLAYPILQAADILVHRARFVPVGADQAQHLEFARESARAFNSQYGEPILESPNALYSPSPRVMSLKDPQRKMSKSDPIESSRILMNDTYDDIKRKIRASLTDSMNTVTYAPERRPGVSNLLQILSCLENGCPKPEDLAIEYDKHSLRGLKDHVTNVIELNIQPVREAFNGLMNTKQGRDKLIETAENGAISARQNAAETMDRVYRAIGMRI